MPKVSVVIPTRNRADMLYRAIRSVLEQSYGDFEVIVVSDASEDNTEEVVMSFDDSRIHYIRHEEAKGASAARNTAMRVAKGEYIAFLDDDDEWMPNKLEVQVPVIENSDAEVGLVYGWMEYFEGEKSVGVRSPKLRGDVFVEMLDKQAIGGCPTIIIKREAVDRIGYFDESLPRGNDGDYWRRICQYYHVDYIAQVLARVHIGHNDRISAKTRKGIKNSINSKQTRLRRFADAFKKHPEVHCRFLLQIAILYLKLFKPLQSLKWFYKSQKTAPTIIVFVSCAARTFFRDFLPLQVRHVIRLVRCAFLWRYQISIRSIHEFLFRFNSLKKKPLKRNPSIVFMTGMPRTGTSLMKNYFGDYPCVRIMPFEPRGYFVSWKRSVNSKAIIVDKSTHYIRNLKNIFAGTGGHGFFCCIVRDPRDQLVSLFEFGRHPELPRTKRFWKKWAKQYGGFVRFAEKNKEARCFLVRYEDLVRFPAETKKAFLEWLGIEMKSDLITSSYRVAYENDRQDPKVLKTNTIGADSIGRYRDVSDPEQLDVIEGFGNHKKAEALMQQFGYIEEGLAEVKFAETENLFVFTRKC